MKTIKVLFSLILCFCFFAGVVAQDRNELKGPKHKNYKPWKHTSEEKIITTSDRTSKKGPEAKNYKPWKEVDTEETKIVSTKLDRKKIKGPKAKNAKPWNN